MSVFAPDYVTVEINGVDRTQFIINYRRYDSICELGQEFTLSMSPDMPDTLAPYQEVVIEEHYDGDDGVVLRGYVISFNKDFTDSTWVIQGHDRSILLFDYFIGEQIYADGENVDFWMQYMADLVGLDITFLATASSQSIVAPETPLGMQHAGDAILSLERIAGYFVKYDSDLDSLVTYRLGSSEPAMTISSALEGTREIGTEKTRNVVKVYGGFRFNTDDLGVTQIFAHARSNIPELLVDKTVVVANPNLNRQTFAFIVAHRLLNVVNSIDDVQFYRLPGFYPDIQVGQVVYINLPNNYYIDYEGDRVITSIEAQVDSNGASTIIGVGDKCPRIAIVLPVPPVYATTSLDGVAVSFDGGDSFKPSNIGLFELDGRSIAVNSFGQQMVLTVSGLYKRASSLAPWVEISDNIGAPPNSAGDSPPFGAPFTASGVTLSVVADETTHRNVFHLLANTDGDTKRCWTFTTRDFGTTWSGKAILVNDDYKVEGIHMEADISNQTAVLVKSLQGTRFAAAFYNIGYYESPDEGLGLGWRIRTLDRDGNFESKLTVTSPRGIVSVPADRRIVYMLDGTDLKRSLDSGETWVTVSSGFSDSFGGFKRNGLNLIVDWSSLADGETVRLFSGNVSRLAPGEFGYMGPKKGVFAGTFYEDNINASAATSLGVIVPFPSIEKTYTEVDPDDEDNTNSFLTGENLRTSLSDPTNDYNAPSGGTSKFGWAASSDPEAGETFVYTTYPGGDNKIFFASFAFVRPQGDMFGQTFPGHLKTFVCQFEFDSSSGSIIASKEFPEFVLSSTTQTSEPFLGPTDPAEYPRQAEEDNRQRDGSFSGDLQAIRTVINAVSGEIISFGLQVIGGYGFGDMQEIKTLSVANGAISGPLQHFDYSSWDDGGIQDSIYILPEQVANNQGIRGTQQSFVSGNQPVDSVIMDSSLTDLVTIEGQVLKQSNVLATTTIGKKYLLVRNEIDYSEATNEQGLYNIYEAIHGSNTWTPVFPSNIKGMTRESGGSILVRNKGFLDIAEEDDDDTSEVNLIRTEDSFLSSAVIYEGGIPILGTQGIRVYPDVFDIYITGQHSLFSNLTRVTIPELEITNVEVDNPEASSRLMYMAHIDDGFVRSSIMVEGSNVPHDMFHSAYPEEGIWTTISGLDRRTIDVINVDMPQSPRFLVGLPDSVDEKVMIVLVGFLSGFDFSIRYPTVWSGTLNPDAEVTDLETVRII